MKTWLLTANDRLLLEATARQKKGFPGEQLQKLRRLPNEHVTCTLVGHHGSVEIEFTITLHHSQDAKAMANERAAAIRAGLPLLMAKAIYHRSAAAFQLNRSLYNQRKTANHVNFKTWILSDPDGKQILEVFARNQNGFPHTDLPRLRALPRHPVTITLEDHDGEVELTFTVTLHHSHDAPARAAELASAIHEGLPTRMVAAIYHRHPASAHRTAKRFV